MWIAVKDYKIVGACLEAARTRAGVTQVELAKRLKKPQSFVSSYETGQRRIDVLELARIADALDLDPARLAAQIFDGISSPATKRSKTKR